MTREHLYEIIDKLGMTETTKEEFMEANLIENVRIADEMTRYNDTHTLSQLLLILLEEIK